MGLFNNYNEIEKSLLEQYSQMFAMMGIPDARKMAKNMLDQTIEKSKKEGTYNLPPNFGDIILKQQKAEDPSVEKIAEAIRKTLSIKRSEGVRDEDIRWWWNLNDVERNIMLATDEVNRMYLFRQEIENSREVSEEKAAEQAAKKVWKFHPTYTYGDPREKKESAPKWVREEDLPLPIELKDRINIYIEKRYISDREKYKKDIEASSTFNALVRKEIRAGNI